MYCYIKEGKVILTSEEKVVRRDEVEQIDGLVCDEEIETKLTGNVEYVDGKIVQVLTQSEQFELRCTVVDKLITTKTEDITTEDLKGVSFSDYEVGELIVSKFFGWNPHSQSARFAEINSIQLALITGTATDKDTARLEEIQAFYGEINTFKNLFYV